MAKKSCKHGPSSPKTWNFKASRGTATYPKASQCLSQDGDFLEAAVQGAPG